MNRVVLVGNVGRDPEVKTFSDGKKVVNITLATNEYYKDKDGERQQRTDWHSIRAYGKLVDVMEKYLSKGDQLAVEGRLRTDSYEKDGQKKYVTYVLMDGFKFLSSSSNSNSSDEPKPKEEPKGIGVEPEDDLPF